VLCDRVAVLPQCVTLVFRCTLHDDYDGPCSRLERGPSWTRAAELPSSTLVLEREARFGFAAFGFEPFRAL